MDGTFCVTTLNDTCSLSFSWIGYETKTIRITQDANINIVLDVFSYESRWISVGAGYDIVNSMLGLAFSNGYDERPLIHFEDFSEKFIYKIGGQTDFGKDYVFGADVGWKYPVRHLVLASLGYCQRDFASKDFFLRDINISVSTLIRWIQAEFILKFGYQGLNEDDNWGASLGIEKNLVYSKLYSGISVGYFFDYLTYSIYFQGAFLSKNISYRLAYDRIDCYDFLNLGLNFVFNR